MAALVTQALAIAVPSSLEDVLGNHVEPRATGGTVSNSAIAVTTINNLDGILVDYYKQYNGNGSIAAGWPTRTSWISFMDMCLSPGLLFALN